MRPLFYRVFNTSKYLVVWTNDRMLKSVENGNNMAVSKTLDIACECFLFVYLRLEKLGLYMKWLKRHETPVNESIKISADRLERLKKLKAPQVILDSEQKILTKRRWAKELGYKTMDEYHRKRGDYEKN